MSRFEHPILDNFARFLVQKHIFCPMLPQHILDIDTCVFVVDADGDPYLPLSPEAHRAMMHAAQGDASKALREGMTFLLPKD